MSRSLNKVTLIGNVGNDPDIRSTQNGGRVATISVATTRTWNGANGERQEKTEWHRVIVWNRGQGSGLADVVEKYVKKGDRVYIEGPIEYRQWQDKDNQTRYTTEINARELILLSNNREGGESRSERPASNGQRTSAGNAARTDARSSSRNAAPSRQPAAAGGGGGEFEDFPQALQDEDDDLPFDVGQRR